MQSDKTGKCPPGEDSGDSPELKVVSAKEALRQNLRALEVPAGADVLFSPYEREFAGYFARVEVKNFDDLKTLGFVPRGLVEDKVRCVVVVSNRAAYKVAHTMLSNDPVRGHGCDCQQPQTAKAPRSDLRQRYESARKRFNPALSRLLSEHLQARVDWDSPVAGIVKRWTQYVDLAQRAAISIALLSDITINRGAILRVDQSTKALLVGTIWIHRTGRLVYDGGYIKIWARAIENLIDITTRITATADIPWLVHTT
jgi:hypothetical protein